MMGSAAIGAKRKHGKGIYFIEEVFERYGCRPGAARGCTLARGSGWVGEVAGVGERRGGRRTSNTQRPTLNEKGGGGKMRGMTAEEFVEKWRGAELSERAALLAGRV